MEIVPFYKIINMSSNIVFGDCSIDITHNQFVIIRIEVYFCFNFVSFELVDDLIDSEV